jgi:hypothetical protein
MRDVLWTYLNFGDHQEKGDSDPANLPRVGDIIRVPEEASSVPGPAAGDWRVKKVVRNWVPAHSKIGTRVDIDLEREDEGQWDIS